MWGRFLTTLPEVAGHPLAILAYVLVVGAWLIWLIKRNQASTFLSALDKLPESERQSFSKNAGYQYDDLANLTKAQRYSLLTKRFLLIGFIATLVAILILAGLIAAHSQEIAKLQERINAIDKQRITLQETLDEHVRSRAQFAVGAAKVSGRLSVADDPDVKREAKELSEVVVGLLADVPRDKLSPEQASVVMLAEATISNAKGNYDATLRLITEGIANNAVTLAARTLQVRGDAFYGKQDWANALEQYVRVRPLQPENYFVCFLSGNCELHLSNFDKAIAAYTDVIDGPAETVSARWRIAAFNNRGNTRVLMNQYKAAVQDFAQAIDELRANENLSPLKLELAMALANRAHTFNRINEHEKAKHDFTAVRTIISELDSKHKPGNDAEELISWLKKRAEPLGPPVGGHDHGSKKACFMCHPTGS